MPIVNRAAPDPFALATGALPNPDPAADPAPSLGATIAADFRLTNTLGAIGSRLHTFGGVSNDIDPTYSAWNDIKGTPYEDQWEKFADSNNSRYTAALKTQIDQEDRDRRTVAAAGWTGTGVGLVTGALDPAILVPIGGEVAKAKAGYTLGRVALDSALHAGAGAALQQGIIQSASETHTTAESAENIGGAILLGGLLGTAAHVVMSPAERVTALQGYDRLNDPAVNVVPSQAGSVGAAARELPTLDDMTVAGTAGKAASDLWSYSPNARLNDSPSATFRMTGQRLAENSMYQAMHDAGDTLGPAVETLANSKFQARTADAIGQVDDIFKEMKQSGIAMSRSDFEDEISKAGRRGDAGVNDFVSRAASAVRKTVIEPYFNEGVSAGLFEPDDSVAFAQSYWPRSYNVRAIGADEANFRNVVADHIEQRIAADYAAQSAAQDAKASDTAAKVADLRLSPEDRISTLAHLESQGDALDAANPDHVDRRSRYNDLRRQAAAAKASGDASASQGLTGQATALTEEGGPSYAAFLRQRSALRSRHSRVDLGHAGLESRQQQVLNQIERNEDASQRGLRRLVGKGRALQRTTDSLNPDKLAARLSDLKTSFADVLDRSNRAQERISRAAERLGPDAPAGMADRLQREAAAATARHERLTSLARRIEDAEKLDPEAAIAEARSAVDDLVGEASDVTLRRGEKAARLKERLASLDPKRVDAQVDRLNATAAKSRAEFNERWATMHNAGEKPGFSEVAQSIARDVFDKITGRNYGDESSVDPHYMVPLQRGPFRERTLPVPDEVLDGHGWLENNVHRVTHSYARTVGVDTELTKAFGSPKLDDQIRAGRDEYAALRSAVTDPKQLAKLTKLEKRDVNDLMALRDLQRGTYMSRENAGGFGRLVRGLSHFNFVRMMGNVVPASFSDLYRPAMVHGLRRYLSEGIAPLIGHMEAAKMSVKEAQAAGLVVNRINHQRIMSYAELADPFAKGNAVERLLENGSRIGAKWSGIDIWNDAMESLPAIMSQNRILNGSAGARTLAYLGLDKEMAARVAAEFKAHGEIDGGVHIAHTERWSDAEAVDAFRAAIHKDVGRTIVRPGHGDTPLFMHTPLGRLVAQFKTFSLASHQKVLVAGLQENKARFVSGLVGSTVLGILSTMLRAWAGGADRWKQFKEAATNPGYVIGEGLDSSGVFAVPIELANDVEKLTRGANPAFSFNPIKTPALAAGRLINPAASMQGESTRFASRGIAGAAFGPTVGTITDTLPQAIGGAENAVTGNPVSGQQKRAMRALVPYGTYAGMREALQAFEGDSPYLQ